MYKDVQRIGHDAMMPWSWVLSLDLLFQSFLDIPIFLSSFFSCKGVKERQRTASGARLHPNPDRTLPDSRLFCEQCKTTKHLAVRCCCQFYLSIVLSWQSVSYLCVLDVGSAQALQCTSYLSTFDSSCAFRGRVERFRFRRRTSAETRQDSLALQLCVGVLTSSQHDRWTWNIAWHAFWTFPTKRSYGYKSATSASELSWDLGTLLALDTNPTESLWDHSFSLAGLLNGSVMGCSATVLSIFSWLPQF